ncbi:MAG: YqgE/AlgH family protein [Lentimicrobiaceae bacterium]|jgi:putative transcriptional regulator
MIIPDQNPAGGRILVSQPSLTDKFFNRSVVMLAEHGPDGSFGFIVNKPAKIKLSKVTAEFGSFDTELYLGGPVHVNNLFYVHSKGDIIKDSLKIIEGVFWGGDMDEIRKLISSGKLTEKDIRFYAGYSGWQPRQLEREMTENSWIVLDGLNRYVFGSHPINLWKKIVLTLGDEYAPWVNYPFDPNMN